MRNAPKDTVASQQSAAFTDKVNYGGVIESINLKNDRNGAPMASHRNSLQQQQQQKRPSAVKGGQPGGGTKRVSSSSDATDTSGSSCSDGDTSSSSYDEPNLPYPGFAEYSLKYLAQDSKPRIWCLQLITNPWFERISMLVILLNCVTLGMYQPCVDDACVTNRCKILQIFDDIIFAFFSLEMTIKIVAMGGWGKGTYLADSWNRLDFFIVLAGALEYCLQVENLNLTAIRTIRVLRPLRAINRIPSMRILVMLLLDTLPMLGNVLLLCFFVFFIFGIVGVQLWEGILRQRCVIKLPDNVSPPSYL
uniref:Ion transport domain-containing protein n=1 Tax=Anopheles christyi TaxID=43041 RepID=A0A182JZZ7_9DIPT